MSADLLRALHFTRWHHWVTIQVEGGKILLTEKTSPHWGLLGMTHAIGNCEENWIKSYHYHYTEP